MEFNNKHLDDAVDVLDACIFSGCSMHNKEDREKFRLVLKTWDRATTAGKWVECEEDIATGFCNGMNESLKEGFEEIDH